MYLGKKKKKTHTAYNFEPLHRKPSPQKSAELFQIFIRVSSKEMTLSVFQKEERPREEREEGTKSLHPTSMDFLSDSCSNSKG